MLILRIPVSLDLPSPQHRAADTAGRLFYTVVGGDDDDDDGDDDDDDDDDDIGGLVGHVGTVIVHHLPGVRQNSIDMQANWRDMATIYTASISGPRLIYPKGHSCKLHRLKSVIILSPVLTCNVSAGIYKGTGMDYPAINWEWTPPYESRGT